jgi:hypothetical protein
MGAPQDAVLTPEKLNPRKVVQEATAMADTFKDLGWG